MKLRGGHKLARALQEKGVTQVFTLSGGFCNPALDNYYSAVDHHLVSGKLGALRLWARRRD
jgi:thiamine pyrophosphate-dependent acetolactate synthase large subunit-like protein